MDKYLITKNAVYKVISLTCGNCPDSFGVIALQNIKGGEIIIYNSDDKELYQLSAWLLSGIAPIQFFISDLVDEIPQDVKLELL